MDQAWKLEQQYWQDVAAGDTAGFYARYLTVDGYVVLSDGVLTRDALVAGQERPGPLRDVTLSEPRMLLLEGPGLLVTYSVAAIGDGTPGYRARITSLYTWHGHEWALVLRQHTPDGPHAF
ncbi:nuclear transport factor 2 family protein [Cryptosporangium japonicum]|uniref:DUF4440 domain-containing protein n=1 Tax=Cryptosporangium japonicum TaxID=80872 RepID=A0ABN0TG85_9ACTN